MAHETPKRIYRNRLTTEQKLISAVGDVLLNGTYRELTITHIAAVAGCHSKQIRSYFGSVGNLIEIYVRGRDFRASYLERLRTVCEAHPSRNAKKQIAAILVDHFEYLLTEKQLKELLVWHLNDAKPFLKPLDDAREACFSEMLAPYQGAETDKVDRKHLSMVVAGIYWSAVWIDRGYGTFFGLEISAEKTRFAVAKAVELVC
ncbi:TetR/AcrR family transcriptional regulator [Sphingobacterium chuzhouense]|uniref:TetR/AcrR family transcriptional regulator n=1 Tax=Sphingobacterium chuzhouense TaxID=1742264 RepID=A0ABR7XPB6_9SPHI|nr:TetR/AcrR family transcriptional regulator [Sphingobacterium chuzhouense]MBD1421005.1 TetR/AcrR family transcriptional regulator [Sphingobacterium chuzhouense]